MREDEFDRMFGRQETARPSFVDRVTRPAGIDPAEALAAESLVPISDEYRAFGMLPSSQIQASCELRWWMDGTTVPEGLAFPYRLLMEVGFSGDDTLRLLLPDKVIEIVGERLEALRQGLMRQRVTFVQQWSSSVWRAAGVEGPLVQKISVVR